MKKLFMFFGAIAVLLGFSSCKKNCFCTLKYDGDTYIIGPFEDFTKKECNQKEKYYNNYLAEYYAPEEFEVNCTRQ
jgi:hypothetical protein